MISEFRGFLTKTNALALAIGVIIGAALLGIIGALVAIPVAAGIKLVVEQTVFPRLDKS